MAYAWMQGEKDSSSTISYIGTSVGTWSSSAPGVDEAISLAVYSFWAMLINGGGIIGSLTIAAAAYNVIALAGGSPLYQPIVPFISLHITYSTSLLEYNRGLGEYTRWGDQW